MAHDHADPGPQDNEHNQTGMRHGQDQNLRLKKTNDNRAAKTRCNQSWTETAECGRDKRRHNEKEQGRLPKEKRLDGGGQAGSDSGRQNCHGITRQGRSLQTVDHMLDATFAFEQS